MNWKAVGLHNLQLSIWRATSGTERNCTVVLPISVEASNENSIESCSVCKTVSYKNIGTDIGQRKHCFNFNFSLDISRLRHIIRSSVLSQHWIFLCQSAVQYQYPIIQLKFSILSCLLMHSACLPTCYRLFPLKLSVLLLDSIF